ncbi:MAG TPA: cytochrome c [Gemmatimonadota bacterium]
MASVAAAAFGGCGREPSPSGQEMFVRYCASCHGEDGRGGGPASASLRQPAPDLTRLAREGRFAENELMDVIDGRRAVAAHGTREMPVWGAVFDEELRDEAYPGYTGLLRTRALVDYLRSIQQE